METDGGQGPTRSTPTAAAGRVTGSRRHVVGVVLFALALIAGFAFMGSYLHELSGAASYELRAGAGRARRGEVSALVGRELFNGSGACVACHKVGAEGTGIRGPNLGVQLPDFPEPIGVRAAEAGDGLTAVQHVVQALYEPDAYVAPGFEPGVMPRVHEPPVSLDDGQIRSIVLFLFQASGRAPDDALEQEILEAQRPWMDGEGGEPAAVPDAGPPPLALPEGDPAEGAREWARLGCGGCHDEGGSAPLGADVAGRDPEALYMAIASHVGGQGTRPEGEGTPDYGRELTVGVVADLVAHLRAASEPEAAPDGGTP